MVSVGILELFWAQQAISATGIPWDLWRSGGKCREELPLQTIKEQKDRFVKNWAKTTQELKAKLGMSVCA